MITVLLDLSIIFNLEGKIFWGTFPGDMCLLGYDRNLFY